MRVPALPYRGSVSVSPMWDDREERDAGICCACGVHTADGIVRWMPRSSGPDVRLIVHARGEDCTPPETDPPLRLARRPASR
ncbi:hypothetical protein ABIE67_010255 [Streptomyces sp. V4I8]|uniref:hypothetical protein n=1 Tax=Streptomyces sp. V4I8 TaxID=3156469 RepID=UPI0035170755